MSMGDNYLRQGQGSATKSLFITSHSVISAVYEKEGEVAMSLSGMSLNG